MTWRVGDRLRWRVDRQVVRIITGVRPSGFDWKYADSEREFGSENSSDPMLLGWEREAAGASQGGETLQAATVKGSPE